jgi:predicted ribosome quality control (RQC) complex YloA/Tae2 family protein
VNLATVAAIRPELESALVGQKFGRVFQLAKLVLAIDFRLRDSSYLFISLEPGDPRTYLVKRRLRDLEKASLNSSAFALILRKRLAGAEVLSVTQVENERVLMIALDASGDLGRITHYSLAVQLTGSSSNLFVLDADARIVEAMRQTRGEGQQIGDVYTPPARSSSKVARAADMPVAAGKSISEALDEEYLAKDVEDRFKSLVSNARHRLKQEIGRRQKLVKKLNDDLAGHGEADRWKRYGELLLANVATARREGSKVFVVDYFDAAAAEVAIEIDENDSLTEAAEKFFKKYTKARNAGKEIRDRLERIEEELQDLETRSNELERIIEAGDEESLLAFSGGEVTPRQAVRRKRKGGPSGVRTFVSSDGIEILVGKKAKDNDVLTFRTAKSLDTWMHAADYPGSHVVIRNPNRKEIPPKTLLEAAQLAAFYSQGKSQPKAAVNYTQKKFVNKPKGAAPGLVSLASFKTLLVEPKIGDAVLKDE